MVDFHTHTIMCGHAEGTIDQYINTAIERGVKILGFSDHAPLPDHLREGITMHENEIEQYIGNILNKKEEYKDKIDIRLGFEVDFPIHDTFNKKYYNDERIDFLLGSCHFIKEWAIDHPDYIENYDKNGVDETYEDYYNSILKMVSTGYYNIVGHFDLVKKFGHRSSKNFSILIEEIADKIAKNNMTVEINLAGLRKPVKELYPSEDILKILYNKNVPITIGSDSHSPDEVYKHIEKAMDLIKKIGYKKISHYKKRVRYELPL